MSAITISIDRSTLVRGLRQGVGLLVVASVLALGLNHVRPNGLALVQDWSAPARLAAKTGEDGMVIDLDRAVAMHRAGQAVFLDARAAVLYTDGHIAGAINAPWQQINDYIDGFLEKVPDANTPIIAYCDGEACELSEDLARMLKDMGYSNVKVLINGWSRWMSGGHPVEKGMGHGS